MQRLGDAAAALITAPNAESEPEQHPDVPSPRGAPPPRPSRTTGGRSAEPLAPPLQRGEKSPFASESSSRVPTSPAFADPEVQSVPGREAPPNPGPRFAFVCTVWGNLPANERALLVLYSLLSVAVVLLFLSSIAMVSHFKKKKKETKTKTKMKPFSCNRNTPLGF